MIDYVWGSAELDNCKDIVIFLTLIALLKVRSNIIDYNELHFFIYDNFVIQNTLMIKINKFLNSYGFYFLFIFFFL